MAYPNEPPAPPTLALKSGESINTGLVGWWPLTETDDYVSGAADISTNANDGTQSGGVLSASTSLGNAASFDGVDDRFIVSSFQGSASGSVSFWSKTDLSGTISYSAFISHGGDNAGIFEIANNGTSSNLRWRLNFSGVADGGISNLSGTIVAGVWTHYCLVWDSTNWVGYVDGVQSFSAAHGLTATAVTKNLYFGTRRTTQASAHMPGNTQNVRVWNTALTAQQVSDIYTTPWLGSNYEEVIAGNTYFFPAHFGGRL